MAELSPMMKQYFEIKKDYGDTILMFRLGDFFEMVHNRSSFSESRGISGVTDPL